jgi:heat shock protein 1/8
LTKLESAVNEAISWLDASQEASIEEYNEKRKELEPIANIIQMLYSQAGAGAPGGFPGAGGEDGP